MSFTKNIKKFNRIFKNFSKFFIIINEQINKLKVKLSPIRLKKTSSNFYEKITANYLLFVFSIFIFFYLLYLSIPGLVKQDYLQNELRKKLKNEYNLEFALSPDINYSILPKPHYFIKDVKLFTFKDGYQKEFTQIKSLKIFIYQKNFFKNKSMIKKIELKEANFFVEKTDFDFLNEFLSNKFSTHPIKIFKSNFFYKDVGNQIVSLSKIKEVSIFYDEVNKDNKILSQGKIFNIPFTLEWNKDKNNTSLLKVRFNTLKFILTNESKAGDQVKNLILKIKRSKLISDYQIKEKKIDISSNNSFIGTNKFSYKGSINFEPFDFNINSKIDKIDLRHTITKLKFFDEILNKEFLLNNNLNGRFSIYSENLINNKFFNELLINMNFVGEKVEFNNSRFLNKKIGKLTIPFGNILEENNDLVFKGQFIFDIFDSNKFYRKFLVSRKNQKDVSKILFGVKVSLTNYETKIFNISVNDEKNENNEILDNLIYDFNNKSIKVNNWISLKSFVNKILSSYSG